MNNVWALPRTLLTMTGSLAGYLSVLKEYARRLRSPWRGDIEALERRLSARAGEHDAALAELRSRVGEAARSRGWERDFGELQERVLGIGAGERAEMAALEHRLSARAAEHDAALGELRSRVGEAARPRGWERDFGELQERVLGIGTGVRAEIATLEQRIQNAMADFVRKDEVAARFDTQTARIQAVEQRLDAIPAMVAALEKALGPRLSDLEKRFDWQGRSLDALGASTAEAERAVKRVLESVESLSRTVAGKPAPHPKLAPADGSSAQFVDEDADLMKLLHIKL